MFTIIIVLFALVFSTMSEDHVEDTYQETTTEKGSTVLTVADVILDFDSLSGTRICAEGVVSVIGEYVDLEDKKNYLLDLELDMMCYPNFRQVPLKIMQPFDIVAS